MRSLHIFPLNFLLRLLPPPSQPRTQHLAQKARQPHPSLMYLSPLEEARKSLQKGEYAQALSLFSIILQKNPEDRWAWHGRGDSFQWLGAYQEAEHAYKKAISLNENEGIHYAGLANALQSQEKYQESSFFWKKAMWVAVWMAVWSSRPSSCVELRRWSDVVRKPASGQRAPH